MDIYDDLEKILKKITGEFHIRVYSDNTVNVSLFLDKKPIQLEGHYDIVEFCLNRLAFYNSLTTII